MDIASIISLESMRCDVEARSKKHALDLLSALLADATEVLTPGEIFDSLVSRERLGCTALGGAVAVPHGRVTGITASVGAFLRLQDPIDFDAADGDPVDLIFGLLIPESCGELELGKLQQLTASVSQRSFQQRLRKAADVEEIYAIVMASSQPPDGVSAGG